MPRKTYFVAACCFILSWYSLSAQVFTNNELSISSIGENTWVVETKDMTTMYILEGTDRALLIDTGTKCEKLDEIVRNITTKPLMVVITHAHPDHAGNIRYFNNIYLHPADTILLDKNFKGGIHFVNDGDVLELGGREIEVALMPGHTPGSIVLLDRKTGSCFSGDAFGSGTVWLQLRPFSPMRTYINSCSKMEILMDQGITRIYCGHYPYVKRAYDKSYIVAMRKLAERIDSGTAPEAKPYPIKVGIGSQKPMVVTEGEVSIVYDPEHIK